MDTKNYTDLARLEFVSGNLSTLDSFTDLYETLLTRCQETKDKDMIRALQHVLLKQLEFMTNMWLEMDRQTFTESVMRNVQ